MTADDQYRFVTKSLQKIFTGIERFFTIKIERTAPSGSGHLTRVMNKVARYDGMLAA